MVFLCALAFSIHILVIDHFTGLVDGVKMSCIQFFVAAIVSGIGMVLFENPISAIFWQHGFRSSTQEHFQAELDIRSRSSDRRA